ncbi:MAG: DUF3102 domain-containing protein [Pseudomonadota bacterium]
MSEHYEVEARQRVVDNKFPDARFDYCSVAPNVASFLKGQAERIRRQCATSIIQIGKALSEAKRHLSHGAFLRWVEWEVGMPARTAQACMRVASWATGKSAVVAHLSPTMLYLLSAPSCPEDFAADTLKRLEAGELIAPTVMREKLKALRSNKHLGNGPETEAIVEISPAISWEGDRVGNEILRRLNELAEILKKGLSSVDFERVRQIVTSDDVLNDPELPQNLGRAFTMFV